MKNKEKKFKEVGFDEKEYLRYYHKYQQSYIRKKLESIKHYYEGKGFLEISKLLSIHEWTVRKYINTYLSKKFEGLCLLDVRPQKSRLSVEQQGLFKSIILEKSPSEVGLEGNIWTGDLMCLYIKKTFDVIYKSGIYDLLARLNLSHQKAHADYGNADKEKQKEYWYDLKNVISDIKTEVEKKKQQ